MSIITSWYDNYMAWRHGKYDKRLKEGLQRMATELAFNPEFNRIRLNYLTPERRTRKLTEYHLWHMGDEYLLREYYTSSKTTTLEMKQIEMNLFWEKAPDNSVMQHTGFPGIFSNKMAEIKFGKGYSIDIEVFKKTTQNGIETVSDVIDEKESDRIRDLLRDVLIQNMNFDDSIMKAAEDESWSGHTTARFAFDPSLSPFPIFETFDARFFSLIKERGFTKGIVFMTWATVGEAGSEKKYRMDEVYTTIMTEASIPYYNQWRFDADPRQCKVGDAVIEYHLYQLKDGKEIEIPLNEWGKHCPELTNKQRLKDGSYYECISFPELQGMIAFEKPNKMPNPDFPGSNYGASDYARNLVSFDRLDELYSENSREVRDNKTKEITPVSMLPKDSEGNKQKRNPFQTNILYAPESDVDQVQGSKPVGYSVIQIQDKTESLKEKWKLEVNQICANNGISPVSLGIAGFESIDASEQSQMEREKATIGTRNKSLKKWGPYLENILLQLLIFNSWLHEHYGASFKQPGIDEMNIDFNNCNVKVEFPDYVRSTQSERIDLWGRAKSQGIADVRLAVEKAYPDMSQSDIYDLVTRIQLEHGLSTDNPTALSMTNILNPQGGTQQ